MEILKLIPVLIAAILVGNMFLKEVRGAKISGKPWYAPYLTLPGGIVIIALILPVIVWYLAHG